MGIGILAYPTLSEQYNRHLSAQAVANYRQEITENADKDYSQLFAQAIAYNQGLTQPKNEDGTNPSGYDYKECLNISNGMMGYIEIPKIAVSLPIYHGTTENVLQKAVGHLDWTSLPTGEIGNHTVLTGHTGLPSATLFTNVDQLVLGDDFQLNILNETFHYQVTEINVVEPHEVDSLTRDPYKELVTLVTCTPYGINSHRLLVQGERQYLAGEVTDWSYTGGQNRWISVGFQVVILLLLIAIGLVVYHEHKKRSWERWDAWLKTPEGQQWQEEQQQLQATQWPHYQQNYHNQENNWNQYPDDRQ